jgi:hypothetical protein
MRARSLLALGAVVVEWSGQTMSFGVGFIGGEWGLVKWWCGQRKSTWAVDASAQDFVVHTDRPTTHFRHAAFALQLSAVLMEKDWREIKAKMGHRSPVPFTIQSWGLVAADSPETPFPVQMCKSQGIMGLHIYEYALAIGFW